MQDAASFPIAEIVLKGDLSRHSIACPADFRGRRLKAVALERVKNSAAIDRYPEGLWAQCRAYVI